MALQFNTLLINALCCFSLFGSTFVLTSDDGNVVDMGGSSTGMLLGGKGPIEGRQQILKFLYWYVYWPLYTLWLFGSHRHVVGSSVSTDANLSTLLAFYLQCFFYFFKSRSCYILKLEKLIIFNRVFK